MSTEFCPSIYTLPPTPLPTNSHPTDTLTEQSETEQLILEYLNLTAPPEDPNDVPTRSGEEAAPVTVLRKQEHNVFLGSTLFQLPGGYVALDASRTWLLYWTVHSLEILGIALDQEIKNR